MNKIFDSHEWRIICDTKEDQTTASELKILMKSPQGVIYIFGATLDDANTNRIYYDVKVSEMTKIGKWQVWPKTTIDGNIAPGYPVEIEIFKEGT